MVARHVGAVSSSEAASRTDRRRPACADTEHPYPVDLLPHVGSEAQDSGAANQSMAAPAEADIDELAPARGLLLGVLLGAGAWIAIGLTIWLLF
jgi:hypothetical protein